jgi:uncharacterized repeat protein (TIGR01451 family)
MKKIFTNLTILIMVANIFPINLLIPTAQAAYGTIQASPAYFDGNSGNGPFTSYITWNSGGFDQVSGAVVYVALNNGEETLFAYQNSCSGTNCAANWIYPAETEQRYEFRLYEYNSFTGWVGQLLSKATVVVSPKTTQSQPQPKPQPQPTYNPQFSINKTQFYTTDTWNLTLTGAPANQPTYICAIDNRGVQSCTPTGNLGLPSYTDSNGTWRASGNWNGDESVIGNWTEWMYIGGTLQNGQVQNGVRSNNINFTISKPVQTCQGNPTLVITPANASVNKGQTQQFRALYDPDGPSCPQAEQDKTNYAEWVSHNRTIASLIRSGLFSGNSQGQANITATFQGLTAYATLQVIDNTQVGQAPTANTQPATGISQNSATLNGIVNPNGASTQYRFEYGTSYSLGNVTNWRSAGSSVQINGYETIYGLSPNTTYYFRIVAQNQYGTVQGQILSFTTDFVNQGGAPQAYTDSATGISYNSATLNGRINPNNNQTSYYFEYGPTPSFGYTTGFQSAGSGNNQISVSSYISGLNSNTTYYYRLVAQNNYGTSYGGTYTFTTNYYNPGYWGPQGSAPYVNTQPATNVYYNDYNTSVTLNATVNPNNADTQAWFEYGTGYNYLTYTTAYSNIGSGNYNYAFSQTVYNLMPNTTYYFRAVARNQYGINYGQVLTFTTGSGYQVYNYGNKPIVTTNPATYISQNSALLNGTVNPNGGLTSAWIEYGPNVALGLKTTVLPMGSSNSNLPYSFAATGLLPNTTYYFRIVAQNQYGTSYGQILSFQTLSVPQTITYTPPTLPSTQIITYTTAPSTQPNTYGKQIDCITIVPTINGTKLDPGSEFTYITTIRNNCGFKIENAVLRVVLPQETDFISTSFPTYSNQGNTVVFNLGNIDSDIQIAVNAVSKIKTNARNGDHLVFTSILNFDYQKYSYMLNTYLTGIVGQNIAGGGFAAALKTLGGIFTNWIFWLILVLAMGFWIIYLLMTGRKNQEEKYDLSGLKVNREA